VLPAGTISTVKSIVTFDGELETAQAPMAVTLTLNDEVDVSRGNMIVKKDALPHVSPRLRAKVIWMHHDAMKLGREYYFKFASKVTTGEFDRVLHRVDVNSLEEIDANFLELNEIGTLDVSLDEAVVFDAYKKNKYTGGFIVIDRLSNLTVGAGMISKALVPKTGAQKERVALSPFEKDLIELLRKHFPQLNEFEH
jgi:sulfate adenylyltransferase subunit 1